MANNFNILEEYVLQLLNRLDILNPHQLHTEKVAHRLGMVVHYLPYESMHIAGNMFLDCRKSDSEQWQDFAHELCHALWHAGDQALIPLSLREYQEWKAENFAQNFCIPSFMLDSMKLPAYDREAVWMIQEEFGVTRQFAEKRLEQYMRNLIYR